MTLLEALFGTVEPDSARHRRSVSIEDEGEVPASWGVWGNVGHLMSGASETPMSSQKRQPDSSGFAGQAPQTIPASPNGVVDARRAQSPNGSESPVTVLAEDAAISPGSGTWFPFGSQQGRGSRGSRGSRGGRPLQAPLLPPEGPEMSLHRALDQLQAALTAWEAAVKSKTGFAGDLRGDCRREEQAVEVASAAFEDVRTSLTQEGMMKRMLASRDLEQGAMRGQEVLRALAGHSPWADKEKVQELLHRRLDFLLNPSFDPGHCRFPSGKHFLKLVRDRRRWPQAEALALQWPDILERTLGRKGAEDWKSRADRLLVKRVDRDKPHRSSQESFELCELCVSEGREDRHVPQSSGEVSGQLTFTRIRAYNLRSADVLDESDPFVKFELGSLAQAQTSVVWNNEKNPEWKDPNTGRWEEVFMRVAHASLDRFPQLQISVWDKDTFTHNDSLGSQTLSLVDLLQQHSGYSSAARALKKQVTCDTGSVVLQGPGAGDRGPSIEFSVTWTPGLDGLDSSDDPLMLEPEKDGALQLLAEMEMELHHFLKEFGPKSADSLGFFLQPQDCNTDVRSSREDKKYSNSEVQQVKDYNELLNKLKNRLQHHHVNFREMNDLVQLLQEVETRAGHGAGRRIFAFQDEDLPIIGEWSTDRRRQLRNQLFLAKLDAGIVAPVERGWNFYILLVLIFLAVFFSLLSLLLLTCMRDEDGRGWIVVLVSLAGFGSVAVVITLSLPIWKPYFDKPRPGASYHPVADSA